jgi:acetylornithine/N-succinyldiaminopimelate aminotransferase
MELMEIIEMDKKYYMNTFGDRFPVCFSHGEGINLWDIEGNKYYDFFAGIAVSALGHSHPKLVEAIRDQAGKFLHCSSLYYIKPQAMLAKLIVENSCADRIFFANSGAEANEGAIKLARIYYNKRDQEKRFEIITLKNSFHGRTLATIAATGQEKYQKQYCPLTPRFLQVPFNDIEALEAATNSSTCAVMIEPIQGESGVNPVDISYMHTVRKLCDQKNILLIFDEVQCGLGRTGKLFGYEHFEVEPDIFTLAKALGGGFPIGAVCARGEAANAFEPGDHGSTFGGNPLACSAGLAVLNTLLDEDLVGNSFRMGEYFIGKLKDLKEKYSFVKEIRGRGLMIGIQLSNTLAKDIVKECFKNKYLIGNVGDSILRILPPLIINKEDINGFTDVLDMIFSKVQS